MLDVSDENAPLSHGVDAIRCAMIASVISIDGYIPDPNHHHHCVDLIDPESTVGIVSIGHRAAGKMSLASCHPLCIFVLFHIVVHERVSADR